jgi:hypothetical protein
MRIRSIKPNYNRSPDILPLSIPARYHFALLWTYADDHGRGQDFGYMLKADLWAGDSDVTEDTIEGWQAELEEHGRIQRYEGPDGRRYFQVLNWAKHQKPQHPKPSEYPEPPIHETFRKPHEASPKSARGVVVVDGEGEGVVEVTPSPALPVRASETPCPGTNVPGGLLPAPRVGFEAFWERYPRKVGKGAAKKAWRGAVGRAGSDLAILEALERLAPTWARGDPKFIPHPTTWLNRDGWHDQPEPNGHKPVDRNLEAVARVMGLNE